jgi:hypothetical protein
MHSLDVRAVEQRVDERAKGRERAGPALIFPLNDEKQIAAHTE